MIGDSPRITIAAAYSTSEEVGMDLTSLMSKLMTGHMRVGLTINCFNVIIATTLLIHPPINYNGKLYTSTSTSKVFKPKAH